MIRRASLIAALGLAASVAQLPAQRSAITVFAASDLAPVLEMLVPLYERSSGDEVRVSIGSTGNLVAQIERGAPADVILAANIAYVDRLQRAGLVVPGTQRIYARGRLVIVTRSAAGIPTLAHLERSTLRRIAIANPEHAPYGAAAREALQATGMWTRIRPKLVFAENVRQATQMVESGAVDAGIVAGTSARAAKLSTAVVPDSLHAPLDQAGAAIAGRPNTAGARRFLDYLTGAQGRPILTAHGLEPPRR